MDIKRKLINTFVNMRRRCQDNRNDHFSRYGGRGIKLIWSSHKEFRSDMEQALLDAIEQYPGQRLSIDRINNDGHYCKENCRWIPLSENSRKDNLGKPKTDAHRQAMSKSRKGKPQTEARTRVLQQLHEQSKQPVLMTKNGEPLCCFFSCDDAAKYIGSYSANITQVIRGYKYRKTVKGFSFSAIKK